MFRAAKLIARSALNGRLAKGKGAKVPKPTAATGGASSADGGMDFLDIYKYVFTPVLIIVSINYPFRFFIYLFFIYIYILFHVLQLVCLFAPSAVDTPTLYGR